MDLKRWLDPKWANSSFSHSAEADLAVDGARTSDNVTGKLPGLAGQMQTDTKTEGDGTTSAAGTDLSLCLS